MRPREWKPSGYRSSNVYAQRKAISQQRSALAYSQRRVLPTKVAGARGTYKYRYNKFSRYLNAFAGRNETKYIDNIPAANGGVNGSNVSIPAAGVIVNWWPIQNGGAFAAGQSLVQIPQATTKNTRIGNKSFITKIRGRLLFTIAAGNIADNIRMIVYHDRQCNGTAVTVADILEQAALNSFQQMDFVDQITILKDKTFTINPSTSVVGGDISVGFNVNKKFACLLNQEVHFSNTTGVLTGIVSSNYGILLISQNAQTALVGSAAGTNACSVVRTYFKDQ